MNNIVWKGLDQESMEYCRIWKGDHISVKSTVLGCSDGQPFVLTYELQLSSRWAVRSFLIRSSMGNIEQSIMMETDGYGNWFHNGKELGYLQGCLDIDISLTPFTNTLPIRRLKPGFGATADIEVVYVEMPACRISRERQQYTCLDRNLYRFSNSDHSFTADIQTSDQGIVQHYPGLFTCILQQE